MTSPHAQQKRLVALELPLEENIAALSRYLWQERIPHRVYESGGRQVLEVARASDAARVVALHRALRTGALDLVEIERDGERAARSAWWRSLANYPVLVAVLALAVVCFPLTWPLDGGRLGTFLPLFTIVPLESVHGEIVAAPLGTALAQGEIWRLFTPVLLHFSFAHLAFNVAAMTFFGRTVERGSGSVALFAMVMATGVAGNVGQYLFGDGVLFGGLSGVAYGLFGFVVVRGRRAPDEPLWRLPPALAITMLASLVLFSTGVTEPFGLAIANAAHWCGLVVGVLCALLPVRGARRGVG